MCIRGDGKYNIRDNLSHATTDLKQSLSSTYGYVPHVHVIISLAWTTCTNLPVVNSTSIIREAGAKKNDK